MARWETETRWYEAAVCCDLFGDWIVQRAWGGKGSRRHGEKMELVDSEQAGIERIEALHRQRIKRTPPYHRIA